MALILYHKNDTEIKEVKEYTFLHTHMGDNKITTTVFSPDKIDIEVGSYIIYREKKYSVFNKVTGTKVARTGEGIGYALKYDLELFAPYKILETINFEDYVTSDDTDQYYTGTPVFYFFNNVKELALRIKANLDRFVGDDVWNVTVDSSVIFEEKQVSVNNIDLLNGLNLVYATYGLDWFIDGTNITIGGHGVDLPQTLYYGKGKGLYEITRIFETKEKIITRLKSYGSNRNLPSDYLREENAKGRYFTQLMLPDFATTDIDYVDAPAAVIEEYGIREGSYVFEDVYPSIEEIDLGSGRIDEIVSVDTIDPDSDYFTIHTRNLGFEITDYWTADTPRLSIKGSNANGDPTYLGGYEFEIVKNGTSGTTVKLQKNKADNIILPDTVTTVKAGDRFVLLGIIMPPSYITNAENKLVIKAQEYMAKDGNFELSYLVKPDEIFMIKTAIGDDLDAGKRVKITDYDLDVDNYIPIQNITIKYGTKTIPSYDMKLSNIKPKTLKEDLKGANIYQNNVNTVSQNTSNFNVTNNNTTINQLGTDVTWQ